VVESLFDKFLLLGRIEKSIGGIQIDRNERLSEINDIIEKLCNDEEVEKKELKLLEEYLEDCNDFIWRLKRQQRKWEASGVDYEELSGDGWAKDNIVSVGSEKWLELRVKMINKWENDLEKIKSKLKEFKKKS